MPWKWKKKKIKKPKIRVCPHRCCKHRDHVYLTEEMIRRYQEMLTVREIRRFYNVIRIGSDRYMLLNAYE